MILIFHIYFLQFIDGRLDLLNAGIGFTDEFELEANMWADKHGASSKYKEWLGNVKVGVLECVVIS